MLNVSLSIILGLGTFVLNAENRATNRVALCEDRAAIQSYCRILHDKMRSLPKRTFGRPFSAEGDWREVRGDHEGIIAHVFLETGRPVVASFGLSSESGDWAMDATYYYRLDGTLAKKHELLKTFYGDASVTKDTLYTCSGAVLSKTNDHRDLKTNEPKQPGPEFIDQQSPEYKRVRDLPFVSLLGAERRHSKR